MGGRLGSWEMRLRDYILPDVLILDDFAMEEFSQCFDHHRTLGPGATVGLKPMGLGSF